ncbi:four-helix bundle copper-binding protein [Halomicrobium salinisoli]|uniref:four-helix bundle copper-binding protein n=1 Tax=Halomicrobium salinisoli TaxID=2878391 RepID=UPI001CF0C4A9|nr:four-helix bundle copper-binding protein [Halomicrobium salinisoli]
MSQNFQSTGGQMQGTGGQTSQMGGQGMRFSEIETPQMREMTQTIHRAAMTCEWCADQCIESADPMMIECIRMCEDVSELAEVAETFVPRQSRFERSVLQTLQQAMQACAQECGRHSEGHCQECAEELHRATDAIQQYLSMGQQGQSMQQGQMQGSGMQGGMQMMSR